MSAFARAVRFELTKMLTSRPLLVLAAVLIVVQPLLALVEAVGIAQIGVDATPQTHPELVEALAPVPFMGFDVLPFGEVGVVLLGALLGSADHRQGELRTTLLAVGSRPRSIGAAVLSATSVLAAVGLVSVVVTIATTQVGLGDQGIHPLVLTGGTWRLIGLCVAYWTALGLCCFCLAVATRTWLVPLVLVAPLVVGLGPLLASSWSPGRYLPTSAGRCLTATPDIGCDGSAAAAGTALLCWVVVLVGCAWVLSTRRDCGAR
jgi:ABC-2 type transport system permease protein